MVEFYIAAIVTKIKLRICDISTTVFNKGGRENEQ